MSFSRFSLTIILLLLLSHVSATEVLWSSRASGDITDLAIPADGSRIYLAAEWIHSYTPSGTLSWKQWNAREIAISSDGRYIAAGTSGSVDLVDRTGRKLWDRDIDGDVSGLAMSADGSRIVAGTSDGSLFFYDNSGELLNETRAGWRAPFPPVRDLSVSANGRYTAVVSSRAAYLYNYTGHLLWEELNGTFLDGRYIALNARGQELAVAGTYELYYLHAGGETLWVYRPNSEITALTLSADDSTLALGTRDNRVILLDREGEVKGTFTASNWIAGVALSRDGSRVLAGSWDSRIYLLNRTGTLMDSLELPERVTHVDITADGTFGIATTREVLYALSLMVSVTTTPTTPMTISTTSATTLSTMTTVPPATTLPETMLSTPETSPPVTTQAPGMVLIPLLALVLLILWRK
jgi:WD40 repeat protein